MHSIYKDCRIALFIDGPNLYQGARSLGMQLDYMKILYFFHERGRLIRAFYYTAVPDSRGGPEDNFVSIRPLVDFLSYNGYHVVTKPTKKFEDRDGSIRVKGNMDVELAIDMLQMSKHIDHAILFSGDGDFRRLVEAVQLEGVQVTVISTVKSSPPMCADDLRRQADVYIDLESLREFFERAPIEN